MKQLKLFEDFESSVIIKQEELNNFPIYTEYFIDMLNRIYDYKEEVGYIDCSFEAGQYEVLQSMNNLLNDYLKHINKKQIIKK